MLIVQLITVASIITALAAMNSLEEMLGNSKKIATKQIKDIMTEWQVDKYPLFLRSAQMHKSSWELMKLRFMEAIMTGIESKSKSEKHKFLIAFMGSSVAAGHDSEFEFSYPMVTGDWLKPAFSAVGIDLVTTNNAIANNPCMPYDLCVAAFAGQDADIVHWEQSYNCFDAPIYEQFARQAGFLPKSPIVVYSQSETHHWYELYGHTKHKHACIFISFVGIPLTARTSRTKQR